MNDPIIDTIIRIKNAYMARNEQVQTMHSQFKEEVLVVLKKLGYIKDFVVEGDKIKSIVITLIYKDKEPALTDLRIFSKPGVRYYVSYKEIKPVLGGMGQTVISTSKGVMSGKDAKAKKVGGELLFSIW